MGDDAVGSTDAPAAADRFVVRYRGFRDVDGRREYLLDARRGDRSRPYTVWIALTAFSVHRARFQDGPDITYKRLVRELAESGFEGSDCIEISDAELAAYVASHAAPVRRSFASSGPPETA